MKLKKLIHVSEYVAEVDVEIIRDETDWAPYLSLEDAYKLDDVRTFLQNGDFKSAAELGRIYRLTPVAT